MTRNPDRLVYTLGTNSTWCVGPGDRVIADMPIARGERWLHASAAGTVQSVGRQLELSLDEAASGDDCRPGKEVKGKAVMGEAVMDEAVTGKVDTHGQSWHLPPLEPAHVAPDVLLTRLQACGVAGLGGAGYPTHLKILAALRAHAHTVVINAVECETGIGNDAELARSHAIDLLPALVALHGLPGVTRLVIACSAQTRPSIAGDFEIEQLASVRGADGEERRLLHRLFNTSIGHDSYPAAHGYLVLNMGTVLAITHALQGRPLTARLVSLPDGVRWLPIGTPASSLLETDTVRVGGPLSGETRPADSVYVDKTTNALGPAPLYPEYGCIRCGRCDAVCPEHLPVAQLVGLASASAADRLNTLGLSRCIECGLCTPVCPSSIDVLSRMRSGLTTLRRAEQATRTAQQALQRSIVHTTRLEAAERMQEMRRAERLARLAASPPPPGVGRDTTTAGPGE